MENKMILKPGKWYAEFDENGNPVKVSCDASYLELLGFSTEEEYINARESHDEFFHPDDLERVHAHINEVAKKHPEGMDYDIEYRMMTGRGYHLFHDYGRCTRRADGSLLRCDGIIFDIQNIYGAAESGISLDYNSEIRRKEQIARMSNGVSSYIVDPYTGALTILLQNNYLARNYGTDTDYTASISKYIDKDVFEPDRKKTHEALSLDNLVRSIEADGEFSYRFRDMSSGIPRWYEMRAVRLSDTEIIYGFEYKDDETVDRLIFDKLEENYYALFYVNLDAGLVQVVKNEPGMFAAEGTITPYTSFMLQLASHFEEETRDFFERASDISYIRTRFAKEDKASYAYKSNIRQTPLWCSVTELVLARHDDGTPSIFALGFSLLDEKSGIKEELQLRLRKSMEVVGGLASEYTALYHVNLDNGDYAPYHLVQEIEDIKPHILKSGKFIDLVRSFANSELVHPDSRQELLDFYKSDADVKKALRGRKKISMLFKRNYMGEYLWTECNIIKSEDINQEAQNIIVGFIEKDAEVKRRLEYEKRRKQIEESNILIDSITSSYNIVYIVNMSDDSLEVRKMDSKMLESRCHFENFTQVREFTVANIFHPRDRERMRGEFEFATIRKRLSEKSSYTLDYTVLRDGVTQWGQMSVTAIDSEKIAIGLAGKDLALAKIFLEDKRYDEYLALFVVDIDTAMIRAVKTSALFDTANAGDAVPYESAMKLFASSLEGEPRDFFLRISDLDYVSKEFAADEKRTYSYKSNKLEGDRWVDVISYVIERHSDGTPALFSIGFSVVDSFATASKELQARLKEDMQMIGGLANEYHALYYFNIMENTFKVYSLDAEKYPVARDIIGRDGSPEQIFHIFGDSELVHPDDRHLFKNLTIDSVLEKLAHSKRFTTRFRRSYGGKYLWTEMDFIKNEDVDEAANSVVLGFAQRDAEIRTEQALNSCFNVLNKEVSAQEAIQELLEIAGEYYSADRCYIFEFSENRTTVSNTYEWCAEGIEPMISKLQTVPASEVDGWVRAFKDKGIFSINTLNDDSAYDTEEGRATLEMQGISGLLAVPITNGDEIVGFVGLDNPSDGIGNAETLKNVAVVAYSEILKRKENDEEHVTLEKLADTFVSVYYADLSRDYMHNWKIDEEYQDAYGSVESYSVSMGGYVRNNIAERDRPRCIVMTSPEYVLEQFRTKDRFSIDMTDIMLGYERECVFDYVKVNDEGTKLVICCRDVTASLAKEREQQKQLADALAAAGAANQSKTSFLFNMSHDIRTPMNAIKGFTSMAKKYIEDTERVSDYLDKIDVSGQQLLTLINQVLEMARIESGKIELEEKPVNVKERFDSMVTVLSEQAMVNGLDFHYSLSDVKHYRILADEARMSSITLNITGNAMKYTRRGGRIDFSLKEAEARKEGYATYVFSVEDTGIGMSPEYLKTIYEPFSREKNSTVSKIQGTGLGMSIVKNLVDLLGGTIEVQSEPGKGTRFDITVDFKLDLNAEEIAEARTDIKDVSFAGRRVLLVEDNEMNREIAKDILEEHGFIVEEADDGDVAVAMVRATADRSDYHYYNFILMDIQMPRMDGFEATRQIRAIPASDGTHIPIIAMTANAFEEDRQHAFASGMDEHLAKPIDIQKLLETMAKFL